MWFKPRKPQVAATRHELSDLDDNPTCPPGEIVDPAPEAVAHIPRTGPYLSMISLFRTLNSSKRKTGARLRHSSTKENGDVGIIAGRLRG